ncbi:hypothetical protein ACL02O_06675 [Micromonospora sp. MS34]|uniref:hypothetical protein n=1 Tax=Micromonospora sp. MS34 TaxID=3385971 RepID=UPI0039A225C3
MRADLLSGDVTEHWFIDMRGPTIRVSRENVPADAVLITTREVFERLISGTTRLVAVLWRNDAALVGDPGVINALRLTFPTRAGHTDPREAARRRCPHGAAWRARMDATLQRGGPDGDEKPPQHPRREHLPGQ